MKITKVTPLLGQGNICASWVFAKVETDEGIVGYGEGTRHAGPVIAEAIRWLEPHVVGTSPFDIESLYATLFQGHPLCLGFDFQLRHHRHRKQPCGTLWARLPASPYMT